MSKVKLGTVTDSCLGKMLDAEKNKGEYEPYLANVNVRWGSFDLSNLSLMKFESHEQERYGIKAGDLIMCEGGEPGRCAIWHDEIPNMKIQKALHRIRPREGLDIQYLFYWFLLAGRNGWLNKYFTETTIKHLPGDSLKDVEIDLPDIKTQEGIGNVLSTIDDLARHNQATILVLENMAKTLYDYWFTQFDFPNAEGKPYRASGGEMVWNDQLKREIPKDWENRTLGSICCFRNGINYDKDVEGNCDYKIVNVRNISSSSLLLDEEQFDVISLPKDQAERYIISNNDIIIARSGVPGATRLLLKPDNATIFCGFIICCTPNDPSLQLYCAQSLKQLEGTAATKTGGSILQNVSQDTLKSLRVVLPPKGILLSYNKMIEPILNMIQSRIEENNELQKLRDWLLPMLMNGQATVE